MRFVEPLKVAGRRAGALLVVALRRVLRTIQASGRALARAWRSDLRRRILRPIFVTTRIGAVAALLAGLTILVGGAVVHRVEPFELAVRQVNWGKNAGVEPRDLAPGFHFGLPGRTSWHTIDSRTTYVRYGAHSLGNPYPPLELRTADDLELSLSVTVPFRVREGEAHSIVAAGLKSTYRHNAKTAIERVLLEEFARLRSDEWFAVERRNAVAAEALEAVQEALAPIFVEAEAVLVTAAAFPSMYEDKLAEQKLSGQKIDTDAVLARRDLRKHEMSLEEVAISRAEDELRAELELELERQKLVLEAQIRDVETASQRYTDRRKIEADNRYEKAVAEGQLAIDQAEALRDRLMNEALESTGGRLLLAQEAAAAIRFKSIRIDSNNPAAPNVLDLDSFVELLVGDVEGE